MKKVIDNFELIKEHMDFGHPKDDARKYYYFLQVILRAKDVKHINPIGSNNRTIKTYVIRSKESLDKQKHEIVTLCQVFHARAYIHFTRRCFYDATLHMVGNLAERLRTNNLDYVNDVFNTSSALSLDTKKKSWVIDVDKEELPHLREIEKAIYDCEPVGDKTIAQIPTKSGIHLITKPFNLQKFSVEFPTIDVHKNNPTILYCETEE